MVAWTDAVKAVRCVFGDVLLPRYGEIWRTNHDGDIMVIYYILMIFNGLQ